MLTLITASHEGDVVTQPSFVYDPRQHYEIQVYDVEYRHDQGESWLACIYQPQGSGPFPALLDVHGGAWNRGSRNGADLINRSLASSGLVVVAVDFRLAPEHPYPAQVADVNYATRWLKAHAGDFGSHAACLGGIGSSSGGHTVMLSAMRPHDPRYSAQPLPEAQNVDASLSYILAAWPVLDPYARYLFAQEGGRERLVEASEAYFPNQDAMKEGNPQLILERGEKVYMPPTLILQGTADDNLPLTIPQRFEASYRAAGREVEVEWFPDMPHGFGREPGPATDRALELMKAFVARQLTASRGDSPEKG